MLPECPSSGVHATSYLLAQVTTPWRKASDKLEGDEVFEALDKIDRLEVWQDHIK